MQYRWLENGEAFEGGDEFAALKIDGTGYLPTDPNDPLVEWKPIPTGNIGKTFENWAYKMTRRPV